MSSIKAFSAPNRLLPRQTCIKPVASAHSSPKRVAGRSLSRLETLHNPNKELMLPRTPLSDVSTSAVATPKVLVRPPGERQYEWMDLWEAYLMHKVVFINKPITEDLANNMIALTLYLDSIDKKRIYYWLNVPGGEVVPTLALYDTMQYVRSKTATVCYGMCLGMGGFLLTAGGEKGYRYAMPHSILMLHHPSGASRGQASDMQIESRELVRMRDYLTLLTSQSTGQPYDRTIRELSRNKWMDPQQAIDYGMIDKVLTTPMPKMPTGPSIKFERTDNESMGL